MGPLRKRPSFWEMGSSNPRIVAQPLPESYRQVYSRDFADYMRLTYAHEQDETARAAEQLAALNDKMHFGVPGFQPPQPTMPPAPPTPPAPRRTQYFDISGGPATVDVPPAAPLPSGMPAMLQQARQQAAASSAAAVDDANQQIATAVGKRRGRVGASSRWQHRSPCHRRAHTPSVSSPMPSRRSHRRGGSWPGRCRASPRHSSILGTSTKQATTREGAE